MRSPAALLVAALVLLTACSSSSGSHQSATTPRSSGAASGGSSTGTGSASGSSSRSSSPAGSPSRGTDAQSASRWVPSHVVVVMEENHSYSDIVNSTSAPYIHYLIAHGASLGQHYGVTHPSEPNYLALFSGSTQGLTDDSCPHQYGTANLGTQLRGAGRQLIGYAQGLPAVGSMVCNSGAYARRHAPWTNWTNVRASMGRPMTYFPTDYTQLPAVSFVIPDVNHDMHDGTIAQADTYLKSTMGRYASWAVTHNSVLVVTWDEDDRSQANRIPTVFYGAHVRHLLYTGHSDHYTLLRTIEWLYGLPGLGAAASRTPLTGIFTT